MILSKYQPNELCEAYHSSVTRENRDARFPVIASAEENQIK